VYVLVTSFMGEQLFWKDIVLGGRPTMGGMVSKIKLATKFNTKEEAARIVAMRGLSGYKLAKIRRSK